MSQISPSEGTYEVGFCKPPKDTQFKPGRSGNPNGRRKKKGPAIASIMQTAFAERVSIRVNGKPVTVTRKELMIEQQIAKILKGNRKALKRLLKLRDYVEAAGELEPVVIRMTEDEARAIGNDYWETEARASPIWPARDRLCEARLIQRPRIRPTFPTVAVHNNLC